MSSAPSARAVYLQGGGEPVFGLLHAPLSASRRDTAVLICPPFGWEDVCSYRSRRDWAEQLARAGYATLRIDLPGTGDSGGSPEDPERLAAWIDAVKSAASWLLTTTASSRVGAIGIGLGGFLVYAALADGAPIDELVLWAVPSRGRTFVRELRAFGRMESARFANGRDPGSPKAAEESVGAGGFVLTEETTRALEGLDLGALALPPGPPLRALLLERDGIAVDDRLRGQLVQSGAAVQTAPGPGYGAMMAEPQQARPPLEVFAVVQAWLDERSANDAATEDGVDGGEREARERTSPRTASTIVGTRETAELTIGGVRIRETPLSIEQPFGRLFGVLAEPANGRSQDLCAVLLNAGAIRRIGPNRMWVEMARRWAARGVPSLRLDLEGLGDADGDAARFADVAELYVPELVTEALATLDVLESRGVAGRFVLVGMCSGAYWSFHGALQDERAVAAFMLNPRTLFWHASQEAARELRGAFLQRSSWRRLFHGEASLARLSGLLRQIPDGVLGVIRRRVRRWKARRAGGDELDRALDHLQAIDKQLVFAFSGEEPLHQEFQREGRLERLERRPNVELDLLPGRDHTLRAPESQRGAYAALDRALDRELEPALAARAAASAG